MDVGNDKFLDQPQTTNTFPSTTNYLDHFFQKNKKAHLREISAAVRGDRGWGCRGGREVCVDRGRGNRHGRACIPKPWEHNYPDIADKNNSSKEWPLLTWEDKKKVFKSINSKLYQKKINIVKIATSVVESYHKQLTTENNYWSDKSDNYPGITMSEKEKSKLKKVLSFCSTL